MEETPPPHEISGKNSWPVTKDNSSSHDNHSRRWPDWDACESLKSKDSSGWPSWECSKKFKDMHENDTVDREGLTFADSSFEEQRGRGRGKGRLRESIRDKGWNHSSKRPSEINQKNSCPVTKDDSSSCDGHSRRWPDWDACESLKCKDSSSWPSWECSQGNTDMHKDDTIDREGLTFADSSCDEQRGRGKLRESSRDKGWERSSKRPSEISEKNFWPVTEDHSGSRDGHSRRWPEWDPCQSLKNSDNSGWPSWECSQENKHMHKDDTINREVHTFADSSFDDQRGRGRGRVRKSSRDSDWNHSSKRPSKISVRNFGPVTKDHSSSRDDDSLRWPDWDACESLKCKDSSGWPSWECSQGNKVMHKDDTIDRGVLTFTDSSIDEQRGRSRVRKRIRGRDWDRSLRDRNSLERESSRRRGRDYSKSRSRSPCNGLRKASYKLIEKGSALEMTSRRCRDFAAGKCSRGSQCRFLHHGYLKSRDRDHSRNELIERLTFKADDRGALQSGDNKESAGGPRDNISDSCGYYCEEDESRKNTFCCKDFLEGKCSREQSCRYSHRKSAGEDYDRGNRRAVYDQNVKPLAKRIDIDPCKFFSVGRCHRNDCRFSHDVPRDVTTSSLNVAMTKRCGENLKKYWKGSTWREAAGSLDESEVSGNGPTDGTTGFSDNAKVSEWGEDTKKSWKGSTWDEFAGFSERPKVTTGWDSWPGSSIGNSNSHDLQSKGWDGKGTIKLSDSDTSTIKLSDSDTSTIKLSDSIRLNDREKSTKLGEDKKNSTCDDLACSLDNPKVSCWGGRSTNDWDCHDPIDAEKQSQNNLVKMNCEMARGQDKKVVEKDDYLLSHMQNSREGVDKGTSNLLASNKIVYRKQHQIEVQGSEPGGFIFPPSSLNGTNQSCHALSTNPSDGFNIILDESVKQKLSALVNQMQIQFNEASKILEMWEHSNSVTADQAVWLSKLQAYVTPISETGQQNPPGNTSGVHFKSNEVSEYEKLKSEYVVGSTTLKQQEAVGCTKVNEKNVILEAVNGNNSKGEQCKQEEENIHSAIVDAQCEAGESSQDEKSTWLFKNALVKLVKEILKPMWMEGQISKEVHNTIVKKAVDKVISTEGVKIPKTQEHIDQYLSFSKPQISTLINEYVAYFKTLAKSGR